jgi:hypothetical protein
MKVKLLKSHRHGGIDYSVGDLLEVEADTAEWLANLKVATPVGVVAAMSKRPQRLEEIKEAVQPPTIPDAEPALTSDIAHDAVSSDD